MSIFKDQGIILHIKKGEEKYPLCKVFFREYGILWVQKTRKKKEKPLDIGYHIHSEIITHNEKSLHTIGNIKVGEYFSSQEVLYHQTEIFLRILACVNSRILPGNPNYEIFDMIHFYLQNYSNIGVPGSWLIYLKLRMLLGEMSVDHSDQTTQKVLKFVYTSSYKDLIKLKNIPEKTLSDITILAQS